jgi:hypothetical protein
MTDVFAGFASPLASFNGDIFTNPYGGAFAEGMNKFTEELTSIGTGSQFH